MARSRAALAVIVAGVIAACGASGASSRAPVPTPAAAVTVTASPTTMASTSLAPTASPGSPSPVSIPPPSPDPTPVPVPPKPTGVSFDQKSAGDDASTAEITQTVTWEAPRSEGVAIRVYGVTECIARPANPSPGSSGPCLVVHTPLPASVRTLLATAPASGGVASWTWTGTFDCGAGLAYDMSGPPYHAVVLAAYSESDHSIFAIAEPGEWFQPGPDEIVC